MVNEAKKSKCVPSARIEPIYGDIDLTSLSNKLNRRDNDLKDRILGLSKLLDAALCDILQLKQERNNLEKRLKALESKTVKPTSNKSLVKFLENLGLKPKKRS